MLYINALRADLDAMRKQMEKIESEENEILCDLAMTPLYDPMRRKLQDAMQHLHMLKAILKIKINAIVSEIDYLAHWETINK